MATSHGLPNCAHPKVDAGHIQQPWISGWQQEEMPTRVKLVAMAWVLHTVCCRINLTLSPSEDIKLPLKALILVQDAKSQNASVTSPSEAKFENSPKVPSGALVQTAPDLKVESQIIFKLILNRNLTSALQSLFCESFPAPSVDFNFNGGFVTVGPKKKKQNSKAAGKAKRNDQGGNKDREKEADKGSNDGKGGSSDAPADSGDGDKGDDEKKKRNKSDEDKADEKESEDKKDEEEDEDVESNPLSSNSNESNKKDKLKDDEVEENLDDDAWETFKLPSKKKGKKANLAESQPDTQSAIKNNDALGDVENGKKSNTSKNTDPASEQKDMSTKNPEVSPIIPTEEKKGGGFFSLFTGAMKENAFFKMVNIEPSPPVHESTSSNIWGSTLPSPKKSEDSRPIKGVVPPEKEPISKGDEIQSQVDDSIPKNSTTVPAVPNADAAVESSSNRGWGMTKSKRKKQMTSAYSILDSDEYNQNPIKLDVIEQPRTTELEEAPPSTTEKKKKDKNLLDKINDTSEEVKKPSKFNKNLMENNRQKTFLQNERQPGKSDNSLHSPIMEHDNSFHNLNDQQEHISKEKVEQEVYVSSKKSTLPTSQQKAAKKPILTKSQQRKADEAIRKKKLDEEKRLKTEVEARIKAEEEARIKAEEEARIQAEEEARIQAEEEARIQAEEEARIQAEEEARIQAEEEARIQAEEEARIQAEEEARIQAEEEARIQAEEEARIQAEEEARIQAEEEARIQAEEEARIQAEEEARIQAEEEARIQAEEEARIQAEEEARIQAEEEARIQAENDRLASEEARVKLETKTKKPPLSKAQQRKADAAAAAVARREKADAAAQKEKEEKDRLKAEEEARIQEEKEKAAVAAAAQAEEVSLAQEKARIKSESKAAKRPALSKSQQKKAEVAARKAKEKEERLRAEDEARVKVEEEARIQAEKEARNQAEEEARIQAEEDRVQAEKKEAAAAAAAAAQIREDRLAQEQVRIKSGSKILSIIQQKKADAAARKAKEDEEEQAKIQNEKDIAAVAVAAQIEEERQAQEQIKIKSGSKTKRPLPSKSQQKKADVAALKIKEDEARVRADEEAKIKAEKEAKVRAEKELKIKAEVEARREAEEEARMEAEDVASMEAEEQIFTDARGWDEEDNSTFRKEELLAQELSRRKEQVKTSKKSDKNKIKEDQHKVTSTRRPKEDVKHGKDKVTLIRLTTDIAKSDQPMPPKNVQRRSERASIELTECKSESPHENKHFSGKRSSRPVLTRKSSSPFLSPKSLSPETKARKHDRKHSTHEASTETGRGVINQKDEKSHKTKLAEKGKYKDFPVKPSKSVKKPAKDETSTLKDLPSENADKVSRPPLSRGVSNIYSTSSRPKSASESRPEITHRLGFRSRSTTEGTGLFTLSPGFLFNPPEMSSKAAKVLGVSAHARAKSESKTVRTLDENDTIEPITKQVISPEKHNHRHKRRAKDDQDVSLMNAGNSYDPILKRSEPSRRSGFGGIFSGLVPSKSKSEKKRHSIAVADKSHDLRREERKIRPSGINISDKSMTDKDDEARRAARRSKKAEREAAERAAELAYSIKEKERQDRHRRQEGEAEARRNEEKDARRRAARRAQRAQEALEQKAAEAKEIERAERRRARRIKEANQLNSAEDRRVEPDRSRKYDRRKSYPEGPQDSKERRQRREERRAARTLAENSKTSRRKSAAPSTGPHSGSNSWAQGEHQPELMLSTGNESLDLNAPDETMEYRKGHRHYRKKHHSREDESREERIERRRESRRLEKDEIRSIEETNVNVNEPRVSRRDSLVVESRAPSAQGGLFSRWKKLAGV
ncbi:hypothetical protein K3495_g3581 [Podosphaera aphanis]|nr:hypothetical protein K3495_g3581 [Podosphaera aphanis]